MRSAEASGASAIGFGAATRQAESRRQKSWWRLFPSGVFNLNFSSTTVAVAVTSIIAATLFVVYDTARTLDDARHVPVAQVEEPAVSAVSFSDTPALAIETQKNRAMTDIAQRGGAAFALAGLMSLLMARRRRGDMPDLTQRRNYQTLAAAIPMGVACWTKTGRLIVCNEQYRSRLNLSQPTMTYQDAVKRLTMGGYIKLVNDDDGSRVLELHREDGECLLIDERPLGNGAFMTLISDVTEAKRTDTMLHAIRQEQRLLARRYHEEKLKAEAASRSKTNFLAHLSHDIRTPLNHIIGFAELMRHQTYGPLGDARYDDYVQSIKASGEHLLASFATILDLVELESGQKTLRHDPVDVDELLESVLQRYQGQAARSGITFVLGQPTGAVVRGDRLGLTRMVNNIVDNSLRFTPLGGRITLAAFAARDGVVMEITDTGKGMTEDRLASLSQPFALGDATFTREGVGPGLGISISRAIAELSGGHLAIDSSLSVGTTVAISLPLVATATMQAA